MGLALGNIIAKPLGMTFIGLAQPLIPVYSAHNTSLFPGSPTKKESNESLQGPPKATGSIFSLSCCCCMFHNLPAELSLFCPDQEVPELRGHSAATTAPSHHPPMGQGDQYPAWTQEKYASNPFLPRGLPSSPLSDLRAAG